MVQKIIEEVKSICGTGEDAAYTFDTINRLRYTHCVALEVLRLHPPVPIDSRVALSDIRLPDGTFNHADCEIEALTRAMGDLNIFGDMMLIYFDQRGLWEKRNLLHPSIHFSGAVLKIVLESLWR